MPLFYIDIWPKKEFFCASVYNQGRIEMKRMQKNEW